MNMRMRVLSCLMILALGLMVVSGLRAGLPTIKDIIENVDTYRGQELTVVGEVIAIVVRSSFTLNIVSLGKPQESSKRSTSETDLYLIGDSESSIYVVSTRHLEERQQVTFKAGVLTTSKDRLDDDSVMLYDQNISKKMGFSSPGYSRSTLQGLLDKLPKDKYWVLLVDVE